MTLPASAVSRYEQPDAVQEYLARAVIEVTLEIEVEGAVQTGTPVQEDDWIIEDVMQQARDTVNQINSDLQDKVIWVRSKPLAYPVTIKGLTYETVHEIEQELGDRG
jgi:hypothetical protein